MEEVKFNLNEIDKTFTKYQKNEMFDGVVIQKRNDGVIFNIGGKSDAFIDSSDFENFDKIKIGDRFKVVVLGSKTDDGMVKVSCKQAKSIISGSQTAEKLKIGSSLSFVPTIFNSKGLISKLGQFEIIVPESEVDIKSKHLSYYINKQQTGVVIEINSEEKLIIVSIRMLKKQQKEVAENTFWNSIFINKIVDGTVKKIMPYGAFVDVNGVDAFIHISDLSYSRVNEVADILEEGKLYKFRVIKLDKENKKVSLGIKQLEQDPKLVLYSKLEKGQQFKGVVEKLLAFGAIIKLSNGLSGLLHVSNATDNGEKRIYEVVKVGQNVLVEVINLDVEKNRIGFKLLSVNKQKEKKL